MTKQFLFSLITLLLTLHLSGQTDRPRPAVNQIGENLQLIQLTEHAYIHRSFAMVDGQRIGANGMLYIVDSSCVIFDTPFTEKTTSRLLEYLIDENGYQVEALVINHFHGDCMEGIDSVHARGIVSYANRRTDRLCKANGLTRPQKKFGKRKVLELGDATIINYFPGPAHAPDNIVSYLPAEGVLFGGCQVKSQGAGRGNVADADLEKWSDTAVRIREQFPEAQHVIPGHGHPGGLELLDYTEQLFSDERK